MTRTLLLTILALTVLAPAAGAQATIDTLPRDTPISTGQGVTVWSRFDPAAGGSGAFRLVVRRAGVNRVAAIAASPVKFDADVGPGPDGAATVVYSRCDTYDALGKPAGDCDLYRLALDSGVESRIRGVNSPLPETNPTIWGARLAFVRLRSANRPVVYTRPLRGGTARALPGVPLRLCAERGRPCTPTTDREVERLELNGRRLAQIVSYHGPMLAGFRRNEVRLVDLDTRRAQGIAHVITGLSGQSFVGLSFDAGRVAWYKSCLGDPSGCSRNAGAFRYRLSSGRYERDADRSRLAGWAWRRGAAFHIANIFDPGDCAAPCPPQQTDLVQAGEPDWAPVASRSVR